MNKYGLHGKLIATAGNGEKLAEILLEASRLISNAKGCRLYFISKDKEDENAIWVTEVWDNKESHDDSLKAEGVRNLISQAMPIIRMPPQKGQELEVLGGHGIG